MKSRSIHYSSVDNNTYITVLPFRDRNINKHNRILQHITNEGLGISF